jgi:hypothetical protein
MPKFDSILQNERRLRAFTGLDTTTFTSFLPHFTSAMEHYLNHSTLDGYIREGDRAITYANSPLPTPQDRLMSTVLADGVSRPVQLFNHRWDYPTA